MDETTDDNVMQIKPPDLDAGYRQQRYRRKNHHAKSRKTRTAKTSLSDAAIT
jgi:predicted RNase H-like nuclease (RuvC/YqgF family)